MANQASIVIRVDANRGSSTVQYTSKGRYASLQTAGYNVRLPKQALQPTVDKKTFWASVLAIVQAQIAAAG